MVRYEKELFSKGMASSSTTTTPDGKLSTHRITGWGFSSSGYGGGRLSLFRLSHSNGQPHQTYYYYYHRFLDHFFVDRLNEEVDGYSPASWASSAGRRLQPHEK